MRFRGLDYTNEALRNNRRKKIKNKPEGHSGSFKFHNHSRQKWQNLPLECVPRYSHPPSGSPQAHNNPPKSNETRDDTSYHWQSHTWNTTSRTTRRPSEHTPKAKEGFWEMLITVSRVKQRIITCHKRVFSVLHIYKWTLGMNRNNKHKW